MSKSYIDQLTEQIMKIDTKEVDFSNVGDDIQVKETEKSMVYLWIRLYLKDEISNIINGDKINIKWEREEVETTFIGFNKKGLIQDNDGIINADLEDDKTGLILMIDERMVKDPRLSAAQPFIRSLFKESPYYEYQVYRRDDLKFINQKTGESLEYIDASF
jgi:hypothetical protein